MKTKKRISDQAAGKLVKQLWPNNGGVREFQGLKEIGYMTANGFRPMSQGKTWRDSFESYLAKSKKEYDITLN